MRGGELLDKLELIDPAYIETAEAEQKIKKRYVKWLGLAACLCIVLTGVFAMMGRNTDNTVQHWDAGYQAEEYFRFCMGSASETADSGLSLDVSAMPYSQSRWFSDERIALESEGVIPEIQSHPLFDCAARYNEDGSLYCVEISWHRRDIDGLENYSDLKVTAGYQEVEIIRDCIEVEIDSQGNVLEPAVTVTERDGVSITARGGKDKEKAITFQNDSGWYQISGSWNDDFDSVVQLLDWFWEHPLDFSRFPIEAGDDYTGSTLEQTPDAFAQYLPDFEAFGFVEEESHVLLKNGVPVRFEGHYTANVSRELVKAHDYYGQEGYTTMHWCITSEPDAYDLLGCVGELEELTEQKVLNILENSSKISFSQNGNIVTVYPGNAQEAWMLINSLQ